MTEIVPCRSPRGDIPRTFVTGLISVTDEARPAVMVSGVGEKVTWLCRGAAELIGLQRY